MVQASDVVDTPAQIIIQQALRVMVDPETEFDFYWDKGEAEQWLVEIASGAMRLSYAFDLDGRCSPVLRIA